MKFIGTERPFGVRPGSTAKPRGFLVLGVSSISYLLGKSIQVNPCATLQKGILLADLGSFPTFGAFHGHKVILYAAQSKDKGFGWIPCIALLMKCSDCGTKPRSPLEYA